MNALFRSLRACFCWWALTHIEVSRFGPRFAGWVWLHGWGKDV